MDRDEFLFQYRNINTNLRKRFLRRPNVIEAIESYETLSKQQSDHGFHELGATCLLASSHLEQAANLTLNPSFKVDEHSYFLEAARSYFKCEPDSTESAKLSAITCYEAATNSSQDVSISYSTAIEAGNAAFQNGDLSSAVAFFTKAVTLVKDRISLQLAKRMLLSIYIRQGAYVEAFKEIKALKNPDVQMKVTQLLLAILMKRTQLTKGNSVLSQMCKDAIETPSVLPEEFRVALDCLVLTANDVKLDVPSQLWKFINMDQKQLVLVLGDM